MHFTGLISVICSTYNRPDALKLSIESLLHQTDKNFEIIIADDGSTSDTKKLVDYYCNQPVRITHVWHEDTGFRLAAIRNLACKQASGDYFLFIDGDCIAPPRWIESHRRLAEKGWTTVGQRILLSQNLTNAVISGNHDLSNPSFLSLLDLYRRGLINRLWPIIRLSLGPLRKIRKNNWKSVRGCNWGLWRSDLEKVNGFDEEFQGWGHEDSDLAVRLRNKGVKFKSGIFTSPVLHLWHKEAKRSSAHKNWNLVLQRLNTGATSPNKGIHQD